MYGIDLSVQIENLMPALCLGFFVCFVHDVVRLLKITAPGKRIFEFFADIFFSLFCTVISYLLFLAVNFGKIRLYLIFAELTGFFIYKVTVGVIVYGAGEKAARLLKRTVRKIFSPFKALCNKASKLSSKILKKFKIKLKNLLKRRDKVLYNNDN